MIGRLPGTLPDRPETSQNLPGSSRKPAELSEGPPGPPGHPGSHETSENQQTRKQNTIKLLKTQQIYGNQTKPSTTSSYTPASVISIDVKPKGPSQKMD